MSHTQVQWARGTTSQIVAYAGPQGELVVNTDDDSVHVQDGATTAGFIVGGAVRNAQTGTSYAVVAGDQGKLITFDNAGAVAVTLPAAGATNNFQDGARIHALNFGAGTVTLTPTTSTINGAASLTLAAGQGGVIVSDGANYWAILASPPGIGASTLTANTIPKASGAAAIENSLLSDTGAQLLYSVNASPLPAPPPATILQLGAADGQQGRFVFDNFADGADTHGSMFFRQANGTCAAPTALLAGETVGAFGCLGYTGSGYTSSSNAAVAFEVPENWTPASNPVQIEFLTTGSGSTSVQVAAILWNGLAGCGNSLHGGCSI